MNLPECFSPENNQQCELFQMMYIVEKVFAHNKVSKFELHIRRKHIGTFPMVTPVSRLQAPFLWSIYKREISPPFSRIAL